MRHQGKKAREHAATLSKKNRRALLGLRPRLLVVALFALFLAAGTSQANPIFIPFLDYNDSMLKASWRRAAEELRLQTMISENVDIAVGRVDSAVSGRYTFHGPRIRALGNYEVYVPVLLPAGSTQRYQASGGEPVLHWGKRRLPMEPVAARPGFPRVALPAGWQTTWYAASIPRSEILRGSEARITYTQPNFPDGSVGYVPLHPPENAGAGRIAFTGTDGRLLRPSGAFTFLSPARPRLEFTPRHRKLIRVQQVAANSR